MDQQSEFSIVIKFIKELRNSGVENIKTEFPVDQGRIDIVTDYEIIEVKNAINWKNALGQILSYGTDPKVEMLNKRIHLFGGLNVHKNTIENTCKLYNVAVSYDDNIEELYCIDFGNTKSLQCEFCNTCFSTRSSLNIHQTRTKYCLDIQKNKGIKPSIWTECEESIIRTYTEKIGLYETQVKNYDKRIIEYKSKIDKMTRELELANWKIEFYKQQMSHQNSVLKILFDS